MYYDILIDKTGQFICAPDDMSAHVGLVIKNKDSFFLSNEVTKRKNGKIYYNAAFNPSAISDFILPIMQELVNRKNIEPKDFVLFLQQYHQDNRTYDQGKMLELYKCLLDTLKGVFNCKLKGEFDCKLKGIFDWKVIAINQISTILTDSVKMGEASVINYLETLIGGIVEYYCDEYIKHNGDTRLLFNVGIPPLKYQIPKEVVDRTGKPNVVMEGNYLSVSQLSDYFNDYLSKNFNRSLSKLLKNNIRFYPLNGLNPTDRISNFNLSRNILDITKDTDKRMAAQLAMSMSEIFANSYRNQQDHKKIFTYLKTNKKIITYGGKNGLNSLGIKQSIMGKDYRKYINNAFFFPTFKLTKKDPREKLDEWTSLYQAMQKDEGNLALLKQVVVPGISALHVEEKNKLFDDVKNIIRTDIRLKIDSRDEVVKWIERLEALKEFYKLLNDYKRDKEVNIFGSDIYLFLANRYSNLGFTEKSSQYATKAMELSNQWNPERNQVFNIIQENSILDKFQYDIIKNHYEQASNTLELAKGNPFFTGIILNDGSIQSIAKDSELLNEVNAKMASIYLESRIVPLAHKRRDLEEELLECKKAFEVASAFFKTWIEKKIIYSNYFRVLSAANKLGEAFCVLIQSLDEEFANIKETDNKYDKCYEKVGLINSEIFYDFDEHGVRDIKRFRAFTFINYLTFLREYIKVNGRDSLFDTLYGNIEEILEYYNAFKSEDMMGFVYPSTVIHWRIAQLNRELGKTELATIHYLNSLSLFSKFYVESNGICNDPRLLAIQIGILADLLSCCYEFYGDDEIGIAVYNPRLSEYYSAFKKMCKDQNKKELQTRDVFKEIFDYDGELLKLSKDVVDKAVRVVPEYY